MKKVYWPDVFHLRKNIGLFESFNRDKKAVFKAFKAEYYLIV